MKTLKRGLLALSLMAFINTGAQAALLIEPHLAYNISGSGDSTSAGVKSDIDYSGAQYGLRAGWQYLGFMLGLDYTTGSAEVETSGPGYSYKNDFTKKEIGVFAGYNLPILLRAWAGYYFDASAEADSNSAIFSKGDELSGTATELGVGFTGLPFVSLNLIYRNISFDEQKTPVGTSSIDSNVSEILLGVSVPLTL